MGLRTRGHRNRILVNLDVSAPTTERFYFMGFINFIAELLKDQFHVGIVRRDDQE